MGEVVAKYMGGNDQTGYRVNVRTAHPKGMIGDAGVVRTFDTKKDAKDYAKTVNKTGEDTFMKNPPQQTEAPVRHMGDTFVKTAS